MIQEAKHAPFLSYKVWHAYNRGYKNHIKLCKRCLKNVGATKADWKILCISVVGDGLYSIVPEFNKRLMDCKKMKFKSNYWQC